MSNLNHELSIEAIDIVIAAIKREQQAELNAKYEQIGIETSKFYHMTGMMPHQVKEQLSAEVDNDLDYTKGVRGWY